MGGGWPARNGASKFCNSLPPKSTMATLVWGGEEPPEKGLLGGCKKEAGRDCLATGPREEGLCATVQVAWIQAPFPTAGPP